MIPFASAITTGLSAIRNIAGVEVEYVRGTTSIILKAVPSEREVEVVHGNGFVERVHARQYILAAQDLVLAGQITEPERGDRIRETQGDKVLIYEIMAPGRNTPDWTWSDSGLTHLRVHVKQIGEEAVG